MHTSTYREDEDGRPTTFHHNGDYSGDVIVNIPTQDVRDITGVTDTIQVAIPFANMRALVLDQIRSEIVGQFEHMSPAELVTWLTRR